MTAGRSSFVDTNVLLRFLMRDHGDQSPRAAAFIEEVERGDHRIYLSDTVLFETIYVLESLYKPNRAPIAHAIGGILATDSVHYIGSVNFDEVLELYVRIPQLSIADCLHAWLARSLPDSTIVTFDREFERVPGLTRIEPQLPADDQ